MSLAAVESVHHGDHDGSSSNVVGIKVCQSATPLRKKTVTYSNKIKIVSCLPALLADHLGIGGGSGGFTRCDVDAWDAQRLKPLGTGVHRVQRRCQFAMSMWGTNGIGNPGMGYTWLGSGGGRGGASTHFT